MTTQTSLLYSHFYSHDFFVYMQATLVIVAF